MEEFENIDEQLLNLRNICDEVYKKYKIYADEYDALEKAGKKIPIDLVNKERQLILEFKKTVDNHETLIAFAVKNKLDLTNHWLRLGFSQKEIQQMNEQQD